MANVAEGPEALVGTKLGSCRLEKIIGSGGMGTVYLGHHGSTDQDVAVKVLSPHLANDAEYVARFVREGQEAKKIDHPNVVRVLEASNQNGTYFIVMEYVRGRPLDEILRDEKRLAFGKATRIIRDIAKGLEAAQARGVIHRDIKPANIFIDHKGNPKLGDFGLAKQAGTRRGLTVEGLFMGTPEYVSPEQAEGKKVDFRTDIYSLGVTYYQLLSGKFPFTGQTDVEMAMKRLKEDPRPIRDAFPGVDPRSTPIIEKMLKRDPAERYQSAKELLADLNPLVQNEKKKAAASTVPIPKTATVIAKLPREVQRRLRVVFATMLLLPGLLLFFLAGAVAPGGRGFVDAVKAISSEKMSLTLAGLGLLAMGGGLFILRRELATSGRAAVIVPVLLVACACAFVSLATIERPSVEGPWATLLETGHALASSALVEPVNLVLLALVLAVVMSAICLEMDEESPRPIAQQVGLVLSMALWYAFAAAGGLLGPIKGVVKSPETVIPLLTAASVAGLFGLLCVSARSVELRTRWIGVAMLGVALLALLVWGATGAAGCLGELRRWPGAVWDRVWPLAGRFPRSGALGIVAVGLTLAAVFVLRAGIARTQTFFVPKK